MRNLLLLEESLERAVVVPLSPEIAATVLLSPEIAAIVLPSLERPAVVVAKREVEEKFLEENERNFHERCPV